MSEPFDFEKQDYHPVVVERIKRLMWIRADRDARLPGLYDYYRRNPVDFIDDWGTTYDPRNVGVAGMRTNIPFKLFPKQRDWVVWAVERWLSAEEGVTEKSRDMGLSWLAVSLACTLCVFYPGMAFGFGSRKEEYVDKAGLPRSLFFKARMFMDNVPLEFSGGWSRKSDAHMRLSFPATKSVISGEAGDNIGRGDRTGIYVTDEDAQLEHPDLVDASLSATTNCRIRISSANGTANSFYSKRQQYAGTKQLFTLHWRDNPLKDEAWYAAKTKEVNNPVIMAQEYDINYSASVYGVLIPQIWVQAAVDAHKKLKFGYDGARFGALDIADSGPDKNAFCGAHGVIVERIEEWSGAGSDVGFTMQKAFGFCDELRYKELRYDGDGMGAPARGIARMLNEKRPGKNIRVEAWRGSGEIYRPDAVIAGTDRTNKDFFANPKAQGYWALRERFRKTYNAVVLGEKCSHDELISLPKELPRLAQLCIELSQPTGEPNTAGKLLIDKAPEGAASPNLADAVMMRFAMVKKTMLVSKEAADLIAAGGQRG